MPGRSAAQFKWARVSKCFSPPPCLLSRVGRREFLPCIDGRSFVLSSYGLENRATISDSRSNFHTRVGYRTNVCRSQVCLGLSAGVGTFSGPRGLTRITITGCPVPYTVGETSSLEWKWF
jgi:hypothetical protein